MLRIAATMAALLLQYASALSGFVTRSGAQLMLNGVPFRFAGANMYWLGLDENAENQTIGARVAYPYQACVDDGLQTAALMGATVVRSHTLGISVGNSLSFEPALGVFNSNATDVMDYAVMRAGQLGIRLIVPLIDNYHYFHGGKWVFTSWRNISDENAFFTNEQVIGDFEQYITHLLNRTNIYTGVRLSEDPTVLAWETGNEISPPVAWTQRISAFLKTLAPQQLVLDGTNGINTAALGISTVDLYTQHFYPGPNVAGVLQDAAVVTAAGKVFFVGEFGWKTDQLEPFIEAVEASPLVSGDLYWSLFPHAIDWGFVQHGDTFTLHYPGDSPDLAVAVGALRAHAFNMSGRSLPQPPTPQAPVITGVSAAPGLAWRGSAGASTYDIDVAPAAAGPWRSLCTACATDNQTPWPLPNGISPELFFRVRGTTVNGTSGPWSAPAQG